MREDFVILVDECGRDLLGLDGKLFTMEKIEAHRHGLLHRAVSVFVFNDKGDLLLQKRAPGKYHSAGKWSNTCCTHPSPGETPLVSAQRRLGEEMGLEAPLAEVFTFSYRADTDNGFIENEFDHVFFGHSNQNPEPNLAEVSAWKWMATQDLKQELIRYPEECSVWLRHCFGEVVRQKLLGPDNRRGHLKV